MPDNRRVKLVITAIADGSNFATGEGDGEASTRTLDVAVEDSMMLREVVDGCYQVLARVVE